MAVCPHDRNSSAMQRDQIFHLSIDAFVRSLAVNSWSVLCMFLGAGASISSGMPSAQRCIWEWKQDIFVTNNPTLRASVGELSLPGTRQRLQRWLDNNEASIQERASLKNTRFMPRNAIRRARIRRLFFQTYVAKAKPHTGYRLLPFLAKAGLVRSVWTTNFDGLVRARRRNCKSRLHRNWHRYSTSCRKASIKRRAESGLNAR